jgi:hypothetical protein
MHYLKNKFVLIPIICSTVFAVMLFPSIINRHGVARSLLFTLLGIVVIWVFFLLWSWLINSIVESEVRKRMADKSNHQPE